MQEFPNLDESSFIKTRRRIHSIAKVIGKYRETLVKPIAKNDNLWLVVVEQGFCTPPINDLNELEIGCNLEKLIVEISNSSGKYKSIEINGKTASGLCAELKQVLSGEYSITAEVDPADFDDSKVFEIDASDAKEFLTQFSNYGNLLKSFHKSVGEGVKTQICLWPNHFDNAFKWYSGRIIGEEQEQIGIGVSNGDDTYELPYIYLSLWPELRKTNTMVIPEGATLHDQGWSGLLLPYEAVLEKHTPDEQAAFIQNFFQESFAGIKRGFSKR